MKQRETQAEAPKTIDTTLPGWASPSPRPVVLEYSHSYPQQGSWGGQGTRKAPPKPHLLKKVAGIDPRTRMDYGKAHVVISEKRDKNAARYATRDLPYPYKSRTEFERELDTPLGAEWNTRVAFQRGTLPRVTKKVRSLTCVSLAVVMRVLTSLCDVRWAPSSIRSRSCFRYQLSAHHVVSVLLIYTQPKLMFVLLAKVLPSLLRRP